MSDQSKFIGERLKRDIITDNGAFLLSANTLLRQEHIDKLIQYNISLSEYDIYTEQELKTTTKKDDILLRDASDRIKDLFRITSLSNKIPLQEIKNEIIPTVNQFAENKNLFNLFNYLHEKDDYTYTHNIAVAVLATLFGKWLKLNKNDMQVLTLGALLHDIGKTKIPDEVLNKPGRLSSEEFDTIKKHTVYGYELLKNTVGLSPRVTMIALQHHERMDGNGYPLGIKGDKIDLFAKVVSICDVFHAMTSDRVYRKAIPFYKVIKEMNQDAYGKLDAKLTTLFIRKILDFATGNRVLLSDGRNGTIIMINPYDIVNPIIKTVDEEIIDLSKHNEYYIEKVMPE